MLVMHSLVVALLLALLDNAAPAPTPVQVVYTGEEGCACPTQLGYQLNVPYPKKSKKNPVAEYGYRVEKPAQAKAKISYSFDFTVEEPRTPTPPKNKPDKLYAKVDRVTINKSDCRAHDKSSCSCSSCSAAKPRYVEQSNYGTNPMRRERRDLYSSPGSLLRKRLLRQQQLQERPARYVKLYHKDLSAEQQQKMSMFGVMPAQETSMSTKCKRKTKKARALGRGKRWLGLGTRHLTKRDIKGEYDLLERERAQADLTAPEIIQFMPETLNPSFKRGQCHMGCSAPPSDVVETGYYSRKQPEQFSEQPEEQSEQLDQTEQPTPASLINSIPAKRSAFNFYPQLLRSPLSGIYNDCKFVDDTQLVSLLSTKSVPDPLEQSSSPLQFAGDLQSLNPRQYSTPVLGIGGGYPVEHVNDNHLNTLISGMVYQHPDYVENNSEYSGALVDPEPEQKKQTTDFLKKLFNGRLGGWGFDASTEPESALRADYSRLPSKTYGYNSDTRDGYSVDTYNSPPISDYLRAWF